MLKMIRIRKWHVPNGLAIAAGFLLLASSLASIERSVNPGMLQTSAADAQAVSTRQPETIPQTLGQASKKQTKKFRVNLFLFRH